MKVLELELSTKIYFGTNIIEDALLKEKHRFFGNVLIVSSGKSLVTNGYLQKLISIIEHLPENQKVVVYDKITQNPKIKEVKEAIELGKREAVQVVVGFGGGSSIDAAKAVAVGISSKEDIETYLLTGKEPKGEILPVIAIPTTAGTGSELSRGAIISSPEHQLKAGIRGEKLLPCVAVVDAAYTWTVPERITIETGFDVLAHAVESYVATKANIFSDMLSEKAIRIVGKNLPVLINNPRNRIARENMSFASMIMGMNLANIGTCLPHRMQYAIGSYTESSHAGGLIALYPSWIRHEFEVNPEKMNRVLQWLGFETVSLPEDAGRIVEKMLKNWKVSYSLSDYGIEMSTVEELVGRVTGNLANDRLSSQRDIIQTIFKESI
jgi:alcohol dehydrogenase class IV